MSVDDFHGLLALVKEDRGRYRGIRDVYVFKRQRDDNDFRDSRVS